METAKTLIQKIIEAKKNFPSIRKSAVNPHFKNKYMTLDEIVDAITPALSEQGILVYHAMTGNGELMTVLTDGSSDKIISFYPLRADGKNDQQLGSAISYGRRYSLCALLGIVADEDDDGNKASQPVAPQPKKPDPIAYLKAKLKEPNADFADLKARWEKHYEEYHALGIFDQGLNLIKKAKEEANA